MTHDSRKTETRTFGERLVRNVSEDPQRVNYPIQGSAADVRKEIAVVVVKEIVNVHTEAELCALIHDEVVLLAPVGSCSICCRQVQSIMQTSAYTYLNNGVENCELCVAVKADSKVVKSLKEKKG